MPAESLDPFALTYNALYDMVWRSKGCEYAFPKLTKGGFVSQNRGNGNDQMPVSPHVVGTLALYSSSIGGNPSLASNAVEIIRQYQFSIYAGTGQLQKTIQPMEWALLCCLVDANYDATLRQLSWHGQRFIKNIRSTGAQSGEADPERSGGVEGWVAVWGVEIQMVISRRAMQQYNQGVPITDTQGDI